MDAREYKSIRKTLRLKNLKISRLLRVSGATVDRWARRGVTGPAAIVFEALRDGRLKVEDLENGRNDDDLDGFMNMELE